MGQMKAKPSPDMKWMLSCPLTLKPEGPNTEPRALIPFPPTFPKRLPQCLSHVAAPRSYCILPSCKSNQQEARYQMLFPKSLKFFLLFCSTGTSRAIAEAGNCNTNVAERTTGVCIEWLHLPVPLQCIHSMTHGAMSSEDPD